MKKNQVEIGAEKLYIMLKKLETDVAFKSYISQGDNENQAKIKTIKWLDWVDTQKDIIIERFSEKIKSNKDLKKTLQHVIDTEKKANFIKNKVSKSMEEIHQFLIEKADSGNLNKDTFRMSGYLNQHILGESYIPNNPEEIDQNVLNILEQYEDKKLGFVKQIEANQITNKERKLIGVLQKILCEQSIRDGDGKFFNEKGEFKGTKITPSGTGDYSNKIKEYPNILIPYTQLVGLYFDKPKKELSGKNYADFRLAFDQLQNKKMLISYKRTEKIKGENRTDLIQQFEPFIAVKGWGYKGLTDKEVEDIEKGSEAREKMKLLIAISPIAIDQIDSKYVNYPSDLETQIRLVLGKTGGKITIQMRLMIDMLLKQLSTKDYKFEIGEDKLINKLQLRKYADEGRQGLIENLLRKAGVVAVGIGLVEKIEQLSTKDGKNIKFVFHLNKNYLKTND